MCLNQLESEDVDLVIAVFKKVWRHLDVIKKG